MFRKLFFLLAIVAACRGFLGDFQKGISRGIIIGSHQNKKESSIFIENPLSRPTRTRT